MPVEASPLIPIVQQSLEGLIVTQSARNASDELRTRVGVDEFDRFALLSIRGQDHNRVRFTFAALVPVEGVSEAINPSVAIEEQAKRRRTTFGLEPNRQLNLAVARTWRRWRVLDVIHSEIERSAWRSRLDEYGCGSSGCGWREGRRCSDRRRGCGLRCR